MTSANRLGRFDVWLGVATPTSGCRHQSIHGRYALADGGWWGSASVPAGRSGPGCRRRTTTSSSRSSARSSGCPACSPCSLLFAVLAVACYRLVTRSDDLFVRIATAGVMAWIVGQAVINIGAVIGLLPVIGVPLPLVSSGGSSLVTTLFALGCCCPSRDPSRGVPTPCPRAPRPSGGHSPCCPPSLAPAGPARDRGWTPVRPARRWWHGRHVSPLLALADCLRRRDPEVRLTALGTTEGLEARLVPERGYPLLVVPKVPFPRRPSGDLFRLPGNLRRAVRAAEDALDGPGRRWSSASAATSRRLRTSRRGAGARPWSSTSRTPAPDSRTGSARGSRLPSASPSRGRGCRTPPSRGCRCGARSRAWTGRPTGPRRASTSAHRRSYGARHRGVARGPAPQRRLRRRLGRPLGGRHPGPPRDRRGQGVRAGPGPWRDVCRPSLLRPHGPRVCRRRPRRGPLRREHRLRAHGRRAPRGLRPTPCRQRRAAAERRGGGGGGRGPARRRRRRHACVGTSVVSELVMDADRLAAMAAASASVGERDGDELLADLVVSAAARGR